MYWTTLSWNTISAAFAKMVVITSGSLLNIKLQIFKLSFRPVGHSQNGSGSYDISSAISSSLNRCFSFGASFGTTSRCFPLTGRTIVVLKTSVGCSETVVFNSAILSYSKLYLNICVINFDAKDKKVLSVMS